MDDKQPSMVLRPKSGEPEDMHEVLTEVGRTLGKFGYCLKHTPYGMMLAKERKVLDGAGFKVIAAVSYITPTAYAAIEYDWSLKQAGKVVNSKDGRKPTL